MISKKCQCGRDLIWYSRAFCWLCPEVEDTTLAGLIEPMKSVVVRREQARPGSVSTPTAESAPFTALAEAHVTCLPGELFADDAQMELGRHHLFARGVKLNDEKDGIRRQIVGNDGRPLPEGHVTKQAVKMWHCDECGVRTPSKERIRQHLDHEGHSGAENPLGERVER